MFTCSKCKEFILLKTDGIFMMGRKWHKKCWNCDACGMPLAYNCAEISDRIFCNECQLATYGPREIGFFMSKWTKDTNVRSLKSEVTQKNELLFL